MTITMVEDKSPKDLTCDTYFARGLGLSKDDDKINAIKNLQNAFNSPFPPFVFSTTSMGQEGLDFHFYADRIVHWNLPSNPVDFEQREGRINRRDCLTIRKSVIKYLNEQLKEKKPSVHEIYDCCFEQAKDAFVNENSSALMKCGMIPHWLLPEKDGDRITGAAKIKRYVPYFGGSQMFEKYNHNLKVLQLYRSVIGQPDPEELLVRLLGKDDSENILKEIYLDFSPYRKENSNHTSC